MNVNLKFEILIKINIIISDNYDNPSYQPH